MPTPTSHVLGFAHRGARAHAPENTLHAFVLAARLGATALESDIWLTRDGHVVLDHDGVVAGPNGTRPIRQVDRAELPAHIPTIGELYEACGTGFDLSLDLKDLDALGPLVEAASAAGPDAVGRLWLCDVNAARVADLARREPRVRFVASLRIDRVRRNPGAVLAGLASSGVKVLNLRGPNWTPGLVRRCHDAGLLAFAWDLQTRAGLARCIRWGVDGVYSDHSDLLREVCSEAAEA